MMPTARPSSRRLFFGIIILFVVNILWVGSSELTEYLFVNEQFRRPYFSTYSKTCMFTIYLIGFVFYRPWKDQCLNPSLNEQETEFTVPPELGEPSYERLPSDCDSGRSSASSENEIGASSSSWSTPPNSNRRIRFQPVLEVRELPAAEAHDAKLSRLPYESWLRMQQIAEILRNRIPIRRVAKLALQFCFLWFLGNLAYQYALNSTAPGVVNVLSSTSSLFTLILAALFPSQTSDRFTLSKLFAVLISVTGVGIITYVDENQIETSKIPTGAIWALIGAGSYAAYLVFLRRRVENESKLDIPMFFGFVGLFNLTLLWPGLYILHVTGIEPFYPLPNRTQLIYLGVNGLIGTVLSDYLWLLGCFLTSSLIATLSLSLTVPLSMIADSIIWKKSYPWPFMMGSVLVILAFCFASVLAHWDWDPVQSFLVAASRRLCSQRCCKKSRRLLDIEQEESLINAADA